MTTRHESLSAEELVDKLEEASLEGEAETVRATASAGKDVTSDFNMTPLHLAAHIGDEAAVKGLIEAGADLNKTLDTEESETPLCLAAKEGHLAIVKALIAAGADVNKPDGEGQVPALIHALCDDEKTCDDTDAIAIALIEAGANINKKPGSLAGLFAARDGRGKLIMMMIVEGWDDVDVELEGLTPLMVAAHHGHSTIAKHLIKAGADVNKEDDEGSPPLLFALLDSEDSQWTGPEEDPGLDDSETIFKALIAAGADVTKPILMESAKKFDKKKAIEILVAAGATGPEKEE